MRPVPAGRSSRMAPGRPGGHGEERGGADVGIEVQRQLVRSIAPRVAEAEAVGVAAGVQLDGAPDTRDRSRLAKADVDVEACSDRAAQDGLAVRRQKAR